MKDNTLQLIGFGSFSTGARAARIGRNPAGMEIQIDAAKTDEFTTGNTLKDAVNGTDRAQQPPTREHTGDRQFLEGCGR